MGGLRHLLSEEHMTKAAPKQTGMNQQEFEELFCKYRQLVYRAAYTVTGRRQHAEMLVLCYDHGYSDAQIADMLGRTRGAVAVTLHRARARLKELMGDESREGDNQ